VSYEKKQKGIFMKHRVQSKGDESTLENGENG